VDSYPEIKTKLEIGTRRTESSSVYDRWAIVHAMTLTLDLLLNTKIEAFILVPRYIEIESLVKLRPVIFMISR